MLAYNNMAEILLQHFAIISSISYLYIHLDFSYIHYLLLLP